MRAGSLPSPIHPRNDLHRDAGSFDAIPILARLTELTTPLRELFGFGAFRPGQEEVTRAALEGRDTLALMPTGSGKSLTYQLAAMLRPDTTLVLSPLIALMKDQVDKLPARVAPAATFVNSSLTSEETADRLGAASAGHKRLVYAAPERLRQRGFVDLLRSVGIGLVVVDEAHCVSMWGHDFRPDYLFIRHALAELGEPTLLGITATATPDTAREIGDALGREPEVVRTTVVRPNLRYEVEEVTNADDRVRAVVGRLETLETGSAIVYARSRHSTEELARTLRGYGLRAEHYHAGLEPEERTRVQDAFVSGRAQTVVATTAFGMGIDKPDVRLVCLVNYPSSLEEFTQMVGRAGRDGEQSDTLLLASPADAGSLRRFALSDVPPASELRAIYRVLRDAVEPVDPEDVGAIVPDRDPRVLVGMLERARLMASARAERIVEFAESRRCRHAQVAEHFGEPFVPPCGACDVCSPRPKAAPSVSKAPPLPDDAGSAIAEAVAALHWPLGRRSLVAALRGSPTAPPSARRSLAYGMLAAAPDADVRRWVRLLESVGALVETTTLEGYRVLEADPAVSPPRIRTAAAAGDVDEDLVERLRGWRQRRSHTDGVPAYVILHDTTVRELASAKPQTHADLATIKGFGALKIDRYGDEVLALIASA
jgi:ATP-dependent DNA helicase RecQ